MGGGSWTATSFVNYVNTSYGSRAVVDSLGSIDTDMSNQEMFKARNVESILNPKNVMRECVDSEEHPNTVPIILGLDLTGSMGQAAIEVAKKLNVVMTKLYEEIKDIEFCIMGIGDLYCDVGPIQMSQFESDIRIAEQLDKLWFEFGGGGNSWESYTAAWYMGSRHCKLDCWNRGKKGIIITMGDERMNPYLEKNALNRVTGDNVQDNIESEDLYKEVCEKFDVYHINVDHGYNYDKNGIIKSWLMLGDNFKTCNLDEIANTIIEIILNNNDNEPLKNTDSGISW